MFTYLLTDIGIKHAGGIFIPITDLDPGCEHRHLSVGGARRKKVPKRATDTKISQVYFLPNTKNRSTVKK